MRRYTVNDLAEKLQVDPEIARGLMKFWESSGHAVTVCMRAPELGRGRAQKVYEIRDGFRRALSEAFDKAGLVD